MSLLADLFGQCKESRSFTYQHHVAFLRNEESSDLLIIFSPYQKNPAMSKFRFYRYALSVRSNVLFIADRNSTWYLQGVPGLGNDPDEVAHSLLELRDAINADRIMTVGGSMGGYAALLFGGLTGAEVIIATGPDVIINSAHSKSRRLRGEFFSRYGVGKYSDLRKLDYSRTGVVSVMVGEYDIWDNLQLVGRPRQWNIHTLLGADHSVPEYLRAAGKLDETLNHFLYGLPLNFNDLSFGFRFAEDFYTAMHAIIYEYRGNKIPALRTLSRTYPDNPLIYFVLGTVFLRRKNYPKALTSFQQAVDRAPNFSTAQLQLAKLGQMVERAMTRKTA